MWKKSSEYGIITIGESMKRISKITIKPIPLLIIKIVGFVLCVVLGLFIFYTKQISDITRYGYSKRASHNILFGKKKDYILSVGENKTLNAAFESNDYDEKNLDHYRKIKYVKQKHLIKNINKLIKIGYSNNDINIILSHGTDESVSEFAKREKVKYLEEFYTLDYAKIENYDRYVKYSDEMGEDEDVTVLYVNLDMDKEEYNEAIEVKKFSIDMLVNKHRKLGEDFEPNDLMTIPSEYASDDDIKASRLAFNAFKKMSDEAKKEGYEIVINSGYRSYKDQEDITNLYLNTYGQSYVDKFVAKPGYSEHQTGLAFDIGSRKKNVFAESNEYNWMKENAWKYGFIERFTKQYEPITGFRSEAWHYRYVGEKISKVIHDDPMAYEEYFAVYLDK